MTSLTEVAEIPLFKGLSEPELKKLAAVIERRQVRKGTCVVRTNEPGQFVMFVLTGRLKVEMIGDDGRQVTIDIIRPGEFFGEIALLTGEPRSADVEALEDCVLLVLAQHEFENLLSINHAFTRALVIELAYRLRATARKVGDLVLLDVYRRLARVLVSLSEEQIREEKQVRVIQKRPTHRELANLAGTSREMVTRALKELELAGHIAVEGKQIVLFSLPL